MNESSTLSKRIKSARLTLGVSQKQLGILAGIDEFVASARINQYERGVHSPDLTMATRLAAVLNVPVSYLYEADDDLANLIKVAARLPVIRLNQLVSQLNEENPDSILPETQYR